jgi:hypothetical protein
MRIGKPADALAEIDKAQDLDSESTAIPADKALILFHGGDAKEAIKLLTRLEIDDHGFAPRGRDLPGGAIRRVPRARRGTRRRCMLPATRGARQRTIVPASSAYDI